MAAPSVWLLLWPRWLTGSIQWNCRGQSLDNAFNNGIHNCRVSRLDACKSVSIPPRRLFGRHGSRRFRHDQRVICTSLARGFGKIYRYTSFYCTEKYLRPAGTSESRLVNTVSQYTLIMTLTSNPMKDSPYLWLSTLLREYAVILDGFCAMARGVTHTSE